MVLEYYHGTYTCSDFGGGDDDLVVYCDRDDEW